MLGDAVSSNVVVTGRLLLWKLYFTRAHGACTEIIYELYFVNHELYFPQIYLILSHSSEDLFSSKQDGSLNMYLYFCKLYFGARKRLTKYLYICFTSYATSIVEAAAPRKKKLLKMLLMLKSKYRQDPRYDDDDDNVGDDDDDDVGDGVSLLISVGRVGTVHCEL